MSWGPSHQQSKRRSRGRWGPLWFRVCMVAALFVWYAWAPTAIGFIAVVGGSFVLALAVQIRAERDSAAAQIADGSDPLASVLAQARAVGGGIYLGLDQAGGWRAARRERAVMLLGPPRSGKTSGVIVPALVSHAGAVVSTSTKPDVLAATAGARSRLGKVWEFDPTGTAWAGG